MNLRVSAPARRFPPTEPADEQGQSGLDIRDRRELYNGFGDTLARAVELVVTPMLFGFGGHLLDGWLGTGAVFTALLAVFALAGTSVRMYYGYEAAMQAHEASAPWARRAGPRPAGPTP